MELGQTFDLAQVFSNAESIKGQRMDNQARQQQMGMQTVFQDSAKAAVDPQTGQYSPTKHAQALTQAGYPQAGEQLLAQQIEKLTKINSYVDAMLPRMNAQTYPAIKKQLEESGMLPPGSLPEQFDPNWVMQAVAASKGQMQDAVGGYEELYRGADGSVVVGQKNRYTGEVKGATVIKPPNAGKPIAGVGPDGREGFFDAATGERVMGGVRPRERSGTTINVGTGDFKVPAGYMVDPSAPGQVVPIPGGPAEKLPGDMAGKASLIDEAARAVSDAGKLLFDMNGKLNRGTTVSSAVNAPFSEGRSARQRIRIAVEAALRITSGAAVPDKEVDRYTDMFTPSAFDNDETAKTKFASLRNFVAGSQAYMDTGRGQTADESRAGLPSTTFGGVSPNGQPTQAAPQGQPTATATSPNGQRLGLVNGQWVPLQ